MAVDDRARGSDDDGVPSPGRFGKRFRASPRIVILLLMLTNAQLKAEIRQIRSEDPEARYYHRAICVGLLAEGRTFASVAEMVHHSPSTLKRWWKKVMEGGVEALREAAALQRLEMEGEDRWRGALREQRTDAGGCAARCIAVGSGGAGGGGS